MKKLFYLLIAVALIACKSDEPKAFVIKDTDKIAIRASSTAVKAPSAIEATNTAHLSALEIVKQATLIEFKHTGETWGRTFSSELRDLTTPKLLMWATDVIALDGQLQEDFLIATDVMFVRYSTNSGDPNNVIDTIAYIPNATLRAAEIAIRKAYADKDIDACYSVFNTAYTFTPITGAEWKALKSAGQN